MRTKKAVKQLSKAETLITTVLEVEGVEPTNNVVERMLRTAVQWRKISFGTRSRNGEIATGRLLHSDADLQEAAATRIGLPY
jgi:transposase